MEASQDATNARQVVAPTAYITSLTHSPANGSTCHYPPRKKRGRPSKYEYSPAKATAYEQSHTRGRGSTSTAAESTTACESPKMPFSQAESQRSDQEVIWPSPITFDLDGSWTSTSAGSHQFDSLGIPDSLLHEDGQESNMPGLYDLSQVMFENVSITGFSPIPSEYRSIQDKSELQRRVTELYQGKSKPLYSLHLTPLTLPADFDVVDFAGATLVSCINTFSSTQDPTSEPMNTGIQEIISQINFTCSNYRMTDARTEQEDRSCLLRSCLMSMS